MRKNFFILFGLLFFVAAKFFTASAQAVLIGDNYPYENVNDGNFNKTWANWRKGVMPPFWKAKVNKDDGSIDKQMGYYYGRFYSGCDDGIIESKILNTNPLYQKPQEGDVIAWSFDADLEYTSQGTLSMSLVFGDKEEIIASRVKLIGSDRGVMEHFSGKYKLTAEDASKGLPFIRVHFWSEKGVKLFLDNLNMSVEMDRLKGLDLSVSSGESLDSFDGGVNLSWTCMDQEKHIGESVFEIYRSKDLLNKRGFSFVKIGEIKKDSKNGKFNFVDNNLIKGLKTLYLVKCGERRSNIVSIIKKDNVAPRIPKNIKTDIYNTEVKISWDKNKENDIASYLVYRNSKLISSGSARNFFVDLFALKEKENIYTVSAVDYSGNISKPSISVSCRVKAVFGASFSDLIEPIPIKGKMRSDVWGDKSVLPRDTTNGMEDKKWSYWGGRPVHGKDGKYHMIIARWPEGGLKGHWMWPFSKIAYVKSDSLLGPYHEQRALAYDYKNGLGHNPDIILLNDGTYALYALIDWKATIFTSKTMAGPWKLKGEISVTKDGKKLNTLDDYPYFRNLSGVELSDGKFVMVTKNGASMISSNGILGPYEVKTGSVKENTTIPKRYRFDNYEDPVIWKDDVQFHMMINACYSYRAIYMRSPDGIHWKYNPGIAFNPNLIYFSDGTQNKWDKVERPHVCTDKYGRAVALSLAALDVPKEYDYGNDNHTSKNVILPLTVSRRLKLLNRKAVNAETKKIKIMILSEKGFDATQDVDVSSLRLGSTESVNFGKGCKAVKSKKKGGNLVVEFEGENGLDPSIDFTLKLIGYTTKGKLLFGYTKLSRK